MTTPTLALCIGLDRWFADPRTTASLGSQRLKSHVRAGVGEIMEGAPTLVTGNRQDDPNGSRNHPIKSSLAHHFLRFTPSRLDAPPALVYQGKIATMGAS